MPQMVLTITIIEEAIELEQNVGCSAQPHPKKVCKPNLDCLSTNGHLAHRTSYNPLKFLEIFICHKYQSRLFYTFILRNDNLQILIYCKYIQNCQNELLLTSQHLPQGVKNYENYGLCSLHRCQSFSIFILSQCDLLALLCNHFIWELP